MTLFLLPNILGSRKLVKRGNSILYSAMVASLTSTLGAKIGAGLANPAAFLGFITSGIGLWLTIELNLGNNI